MLPRDSSHKIERSSEFYRRVFGWDIRTRGPGDLGFDDGVGEVSGGWVPGRPPSRLPGVLFYIMVDNVEAAIAAIIENGCEIVQPVGADAPEITARFRDPGGNVIGIHQHRASA